MTSLINPNNINGNYPVAGVSNNSQGFRDNFTNTRTNFEYAADEITELQNKAVLKSALSGGTLNNNMQGATLSNVQLQSSTYTVNPLGTLSGSVVIDYSLGQFQTVTTNGPISLGFNNWPAAGIMGIVSVIIKVTNVAHTLTLPSVVTLNAVGIQGWVNTNVITFAATGTYTFEFSSSNNGYTVAVNESNNVLRGFNASSDYLVAGAVNLLTTASFCYSNSNQTATMAPGVAGQVKTFAQLATGGGMVITVTNAAWNITGTGTITLGSQGSGCTLQYLNNLWVCVGNNGAVFA
jgi:hypothetical protein